jgi:hypothetical protein
VGLVDLSRDSDSSFIVHNSRMGPTTYSSFSQSRGGSHYQLRPKKISLALDPYHSMGLGFDSLNELGISSVGRKSDLKWV